MLNELLLAHRGLRQANIPMVRRHLDVKDTGKRPTLRVRLGASGEVVDVDPVPADLVLWTLGKGKKKRFPFLQPNAPLMRCMSDETKAMLDSVPALRSDKRRSCVLELCQETAFNEPELKEWPGVRDRNGNWSQERDDYLNALRNRRDSLNGLCDTDGKSVLAVLNRFLIACERDERGGVDLLRQIATKLIERLRHSTEDDWLRVSEPLLFQGGGALFFDVPSTDFARLVSDPRQAIAVSQVLGELDKGLGGVGKCSLTGDTIRLVDNTYPELVVPVIGQTILFSRFDAIPSNARYGCFGPQSFRAGQAVVENLAAVLRSLTSREREGMTWRTIPGEAPKQSDLLLAFVEGAVDAPVIETLAEEDFADETPGSAHDSCGCVAVFEKRAERLIELVRAEIGGDVTKTPVQLAVFRKVDPANRKVVYSGRLTVGELYDAARNWTAGERNVPPWLTLPVLPKGEHKPVPMSPPHIAPLGLIALTRQFYIRGGLERQEVVGLPAAEALRFYLDHTGNADHSASRQAERMLRLMLTRRMVLVAATAHALRQGFAVGKAYDRREALRTVALLGVTLHKLSREKEAYMNDVAFRLGQLLAAADVVHAGYCADVRGGDLPPALLGNQVFTMAQVAPVKALAVLSRRWKPYDGWAKRVAREPKRADMLIGSKKKDEQQRGWDIRRALRHAREMRPLASELASALGDCCVNDVFRAELLLGYIAGFPKAQEVVSTDNQIHDVEQEK